MKRKFGLLKILSLALVGAFALGAACTPPDDSGVTYTPHWNDDGVLKILLIGNSFSEDAVENLYDMAKAAGVEQMELGHLYIGGCSLATHLQNISFNLPQYRYSSKIGDDVWRTSLYTKPSVGFEANDWDFVTIQQSSDQSGKANTYDDVNPLLDKIQSQCTNENVAFAWHMTWAYQQDTDHWAFPDYSSNQTTMYNAIVSSVQQKIVTNKRIVKIIPSGTAIQNARTSYLGDTLTRDGYHLSLNQGRLIASASYLASLIDVDWDSVDLSSISDDADFVKVLKESVKNAVKTPFSVTASTITEKAN